MEEKEEQEMRGAKEKEGEIDERREERRWRAAAWYYRGAAKRRGLRCCSWRGQGETRGGTTQSCPPPLSFFLCLSNLCSLSLSLSHWLSLFSSAFSELPFISASYIPPSCVLLVAPSAFFIFKFSLSHRLTLLPLISFSLCLFIHVSL